jgi:hypothetical protein
MTIHLFQWSYINARLAHIDQKITEPLVLGQIPVGPREQNTEISVVRAGIPDFLSVDDPFTTNLFSPGTGSRKIGSTTGFTEQLAPTVFAGQYWSKVSSFLII